MLIEIFTDKIFSETTAWPDNNHSKRVPFCTIIDNSDTHSMGEKYKIARDFIINAINCTRYPIKYGGYYTLEIEYYEPDLTNTLSASSYLHTSFKFNFKFDMISDKKEKTLHGSLIINTKGEVINYSRDYYDEDKKDTYPSSAHATGKYVTDSTSSSGRRFVLDADSVTNTQDFIKNDSVTSGISSSNTQATTSTQDFNKNDSVSESATGSNINISANGMKSTIKEPPFAKATISRASDHSN